MGMAEILQKVSRFEKSICEKCSHRKVCCAIDNQPCFECNQFAEEVVHGWWDKYEDDKFMGYDANGRIQYRKVYTYYCGRCGRGTAVKTNYCPNCGADMRERKENG